MEVVAEGLWADYEEKKGEIVKAVKCLEAIYQSSVSFFPIIEIKTRLRIATLLLKHSHNHNHAKSHLERSQLLLKSIPSCFELKCRAYSSLIQFYNLVGAIPLQKQILNKGLEVTASFGDGGDNMDPDKQAKRCLLARQRYAMNKLRRQSDPHSMNKYLEAHKRKQDATTHRWQSSTNNRGC